MAMQDELSRRALLRIGARAFWVQRHRSAGHPPPRRRTRARSCIFILLQGGPSHHDLWDPKPDASPEIRGPFESIATRLPGLRFGSLLGQTATIADRLCVVRSMTHQFNNHIAGTYITLTGSTNQPNQDREAHSDDFPGPGAILNQLERAAFAGATPSVPRERFAADLALHSRPVEPDAGAIRWLSGKRPRSVSDRGGSVAVALSAAGPGPGGRSEFAARWAIG